MLIKCLNKFSLRWLNRYSTSLTSLFFKGFIFCFALFFLFTGKDAHAVVITWGGGGTTNNWSEAANWVGGTLPGSADTATFNTTSVKNGTIDASWTNTLGGIDIQAGYTGIITQANTLNVSGNFSQAAGTFTGATQAITAASFTLTGGTFTSTSGTFTLSGDFNQTGGTFSHHSGTVTFNSNSTVTCGSVTFNQVNFVYSLGTVTINAGCVIPVGNSATISQVIINNGRINAGTGTLTFQGSYTSNTGAILAMSGTTMSAGGFNLEWRNLSSWINNID